MAATLKIKPFDAAEFLDTDEAIAAFLADALDSGDASVFQEALQTAARARGMSEIASAAGLGRESLYKALRPDAQPRFDTVLKVLLALGVKMDIAPQKKRKQSRGRWFVDTGDRIPGLAAGGVAAKRPKDHVAKAPAPRSSRGKIAS